MKRQMLIFLSLLTIASISFGESLTAMTASETQKTLIDKTFTTIPISMLHGQTLFTTFKGYFSKDGQCFGKLFDWNSEFWNTRSSL